MHIWRYSSGSGCNADSARHNLSCHIITFYRVSLISIAGHSPYGPISTRLISLKLVRRTSENFQLDIMKWEMLSIQKMCGKAGKRKKDPWNCPSAPAHQKPSLPNGQKYHGHKMQSTNLIQAWLWFTCSKIFHGVSLPTLLYLSSKPGLTCPLPCGIKLNFVLWYKGTAISTSMHPVISQHWVNYYHASLHYHVFTHPFVPLDFHDNLRCKDRCCQCQMWH